MYHTDSTKRVQFRARGNVLQKSKCTSDVKNSSSKFIGIQENARFIMHLADFVSQPFERSDFLESYQILLQPHGELQSCRK